MDTSHKPLRRTRSAGQSRPSRLNRMALELRVHGLTYQQIGRVLNISTTMAHQRVHRALARLGTRVRKVLVRAANLHRSMIRRRQLSLREIVERFYQNRTPRQRKELQRQFDQAATEKTSGQNSKVRLQPKAGQALACHRTKFRTPSGQNGANRDANSWQPMSSVATAALPDKSEPTLQGASQLDCRTELATPDGQKFCCQYKECGVKAELKGAMMGRD